MIKFTNIQIGRVSNGWIVIGSPKPGASADPEDTVLVQDDEDLAGAIAAALVAGKFKASNMNEKQVAVPQVNINSLLGATNSVGIGEAGLEGLRVRWEEQQRQRDEAAELQRYTNTHAHPYGKDPLV